MSEQSQPSKFGWYVVGDEIRARMWIRHGMNLMGVDVVFEHSEDANITLTLSGVPELVADPDEVRPNMVIKGSEVLLSAEVDLEHIPGPYVFRYAEFHTASGQAIRYDAVDDAVAEQRRIKIDPDAFSVLSEPMEIEEASLRWED